MKKILLIIAVAGLTFVACKKDRVCSCKTVTEVKGGPLAGSVVADREYTMTDAGYMPAYYHCTHKKTSDTLMGGTITVDENCSLK
jgi:hypothetical protein